MIFNTVLQIQDDNDKILKNKLIQSVPKHFRKF